MGDEALLALRTDRCLSLPQLLTGVRAPVTQPGIELGLSSFYVQRAFHSRLLDANLFHACFAFLKQERFDDLIVRSHGMHGRLVHHSQVNHPQPYRIEYGVCHGGGGGGECILTSYPSTKCPREWWSKRHMPSLPFALMRHICCGLRHLLPDCVKGQFPNSLTLHWYPSASTPGEARGNTKVGFHTDSFCAPGQTTEQLAGSPVISVTFGETMCFWARREGEWEAIVTLLEHCSVFIWCEEDDHSGVKHSVQYVAEGVQDNVRAGEGRWGLIGRWMTRKRTYAVTFPHRMQERHVRGRST